MTERINFEDEIAKNKIKSVILMSVIVLFFIILAYVISYVLDPSLFFAIMVLSIIISLVYIWVSYYNSDKIALSSVSAQLASHTAHRQLINSVESMSIASGLPMPRVYVMNSEQINAFASGRDPKNAVICVTSGALKKLSKQELEGVIAHEMSHIANYDIRFMTLTAVLVGMVSIAAEIFLRSLWFKGSSNDNKNANAILLILGLAFAILAPIAVQLVSLAISRKREFTADATGVKFTRFPKGLHDALIKIKHEHVTDNDKKRYPKALAPLFIANPFRAGNIQKLFSTHPPLDDRIKILDSM